MAFNALVNLGTVGEDITGNTVSISGCTGASCGSGCTSLATGQAVSGFPKTITGIPDNVVSLFVRVDNGQCSGTTQCISINFVAGATATPTATPVAATATPTPTPTATPVGATATPTATPTSTPTSTPTPTPTATVVMYGCGDTVSDTYAPSTFVTQTKYLDLSDATNGDIITITFVANDRPNRFNIYGDSSLIANSGWVGADNTYAGPWGAPGSLVDADGNGSFTFTYSSGTTYELRVDVGPANPDGTPPNPSDAWSVTIGCSPAPTATPVPTAIPYYDFYIASPSQTSQTGSTYCVSPGYVMSAVVKSTSSTISGMLNYTIYDSNLDPFVGAGSGYVYAISTTQYENTFTLGTWYFVEIDSMGMVTNVGNMSCSGGQNPF